MRMFRRLGDTSGSAAVELALIAPFLIALGLGSFELYRFIQAQIRVKMAAVAIADLVAQQDTVTTTIMSDICKGATYVMAPYSTSGLKAVVSSVTYGSSGRAQDWQDVTCGSATATSNAVSLATTDTPSSGNSAIVVTATYAYTAALTYRLSSTATITATAIAKPRNGTTITHS